MTDFPVVVTQGGAQPTPVTTLYEKLISQVAARVPDYTANLPPALVTDLASTATGALAIIDQAMVDLINSVTPYGANIPLLLQLGEIYGVTRGTGSNTSVYVVFTGDPGFVIPKVFVSRTGIISMWCRTTASFRPRGRVCPCGVLLRTKVYGRCLRGRSPSW